MNLYFVYVINIRFICDGEIYLLTFRDSIHIHLATLIANRLIGFLTWIDPVSYWQSYKLNKKQKKQI